MNIKKMRFFILELLIVLIITIPAVSSLLNNRYFSMHDDQHIARLFLLDKGIKQGDFYPRWVDTLGFNFGYPLFNFYPPLIYYIGEFFHLLGFTLIWSIKLVFVLGFFIGAFGMFLLAKKFIDRWSAIVVATLYTYFFYHAVLIYVRGALAEFFSLAVLPFVFLTLENLRQKATLKNSLFFGITIALLILSHPLIAFPAMFFIVIMAVYFIWQSREKWEMLLQSILGGVIGLALSAFFWLPSLLERKYTLVDSILTRELANYKIHFIYIQQFLNSVWGFGGSIAGPNDGLTFQLGKIHLALTLGALILSFIYIRQKREKEKIRDFYFIFALLLIGLFMTTFYASSIWDKISYLWYLQFPWRFLTFTSIFISLVGGFSIYFATNLFSGKESKIINATLVLIISLSTILIYQKYFKPQNYLTVTDSQRTSFDEIAWRISSTSFEFVPKGVATKKSKLDTTVLDIEKNDIRQNLFEIIGGLAKVEVLKNKMREKQLSVEANSQAALRLNSFNFPGWTAYIDGAATTIEDNNKYKLITILVPPGSHKVRFVFKNTPTRILADVISVGTFLGIIYFFLISKLKKVKG